MKIVYEDSEHNALTLKMPTVFSEEEFYQLCIANQDLRLERDKNQNIIIMSPTGSLSGYYEDYLITNLSNWNNRTKLGYTFSSNAGFTLPNGAVRSPDACFILKERFDALPENDKEKFAHICPDFIIELKSTTDSIKELKEKMEEYIANGCHSAWLIDRFEKKAFIYRTDGSMKEINDFTKKLMGEGTVKGFKLDLTFFQ